MSGVEFRNAAWMARCVGRGELAPFRDEELDELARTLGSRTVPIGTPLLSADEPIGRVTIIRRGEVELTRRFRGKRVVLSVLRAGDLLGDVSFLCRKAPPFDATCVTECELVEVPEETFFRLLEQRPLMMRRVLFSVAARLERTQHRLIALTSGDLRHQVAMLLLDQTDGEPGSLRIAQSTIAELLGATRPSVNRVLKDLEGDGAIGLAYRRVDVVDPGRLRSVLNA